MCSSMRLRHHWLVSGRITEAVATSDLCESEVVQLAASITFLFSVADFMNYFNDVVFTCMIVRYVWLHERLLQLLLRRLAEDRPSARHASI
jgi:hypothetical protein